MSCGTGSSDLSLPRTSCESPVATRPHGHKMYGPKVNGAGNNLLNLACTLRSPQVYGRNIRKNTTGQSSGSEEGHGAVITVKGFGIACPLRHMIVQHGMVWRDLSGPPIPLFLFFFFQSSRRRGALSYSPKTPREMHYSSMLNSNRR